MNTGTDFPIERWDTPNRDGVLAWAVYRRWLEYATENQITANTMTVGTIEQFRKLEFKRYRYPQPGWRAFIKMLHVYITEKKLPDIGLPPLDTKKVASYKMHESALPQRLKESVDKCLINLAKPRVRKRQMAHAIRNSTKSQYRNLLLRFIGFLHNLNCETGNTTPTSLELKDIITLDNVKKYFDHIRDSRHARNNISGKSHYGKYEQSLCWQFAVIASIGLNNPELGKQIRQFDNPNVAGQFKSFRESQKQVPEHQTWITIASFLLKDDAPDPKTLTWDKARDIRDAVIFVLLALYGIRRAALATLKLGDHVQFSENHIRLRIGADIAKTRRDTALAIPNELTPIFKYYITHVRSLLLGTKPEQNNFLLNDNGHPMQPATVSGIVKSRSRMIMDIPLNPHQSRKSLTTEYNRKHKDFTVLGCVLDAAPEILEEYYDITDPAARAAHTYTDFLTNGGSNDCSN